MAHKKKSSPVWKKLFCFNSLTVDIDISGQSISLRKKRSRGERSKRFFNSLKSSHQAQLFVLEVCLSVCDVSEFLSPAISHLYRKHHTCCVLFSVTYIYTIQNEPFITIHSVLSIRCERFGWVDKFQFWSNFLCSGKKRLHLVSELILHSCFSINIH